MSLVVPDVAPIAVLTEFVSSIAGTVVGVSGVVAGSTRAWAVLTREPHERIERMTAIGFVAGAVCAIAIVCIDAILELYLNGMPRGLLIRCSLMILGGILLTIVLDLVDPPPNLGGIAIFAYAMAMGIGIADYGVKHPDEFPPRSRRR
ncbi:MAG TPA: hypothetical protein VLK89_03635 [Solirubrobacterales bacterium]|nr:hypothetical protein [Solirubrobacterales bacterium]